jgi:hypothetical protein
MSLLLPPQVGEALWASLHSSSFHRCGERHLHTFSLHQAGAKYRLDDSFHMRMTALNHELCTAEVPVALPCRAS